MISHSVNLEKHTYPSKIMYKSPLIRKWNPLTYISRKSKLIYLTRDDPALVPVCFCGTYTRLTGRNSYYDHIVHTMQESQQEISR